jgi:S-adenosylmethionine:tRNA ribosyltransferase-isomerase
MQLSDFDYDLPEQLIAQFPPAERGQSRLLHVNGPTLRDMQFSQLPELLVPGDVLVFNDTKVIKARLFGQKESGGQIEILIERVLNPQEALAQIRASKSPKAGSKLWLAERWPATVIERVDDFYRLSFDADIFEIMQQSGQLPLPPYIERDGQQNDDDRYQTVYAKNAGAVAAPTAGLHFDDPLIKQLRRQGIITAYLTLHVGAGTFQPVRVENIREHSMHSEVYEVPPLTAELVREAKQDKRRVIAVGTTSMRTLESAVQKGEVQAGRSETSIFITPGYNFKVVDRLLTNFHLPKSTLMMLVSAFAGHANIMAAYQHAIANEYRFFSYGDAMLLDKLK